MTTQWILQRINKNNHRRFIADWGGEQGGTCRSLESAKKWDTEAHASQFKIVNGLDAFDVVLSDGTDDREKEVAEYWASKGRGK
jgi:hypothetical protein